MQPMLVMSASFPGILYINGSFAGELSADAPLLRPVACRGAVYLDYRPLAGAYRSMARRLVFSGGVPMVESVEDADNLNVVIWPGNVVELEFSPEIVCGMQRSFRLGGHSFVLDMQSMRLMCGDRQLCTLPADAQIPELHSLPEGEILIGRCGDGMYLLSMDASFRTQTGFLRAARLDIESDGRIRAVSAPGDLVGHASLETWKLTPDGLTLLSSEPAWSNGAPRWPKTPEETVRAAVEAALAGLNAEAEGYLSPALRSRAPFAGIRDRCDLCVEMKYALPSAKPCVGLMRLQGDRLGHVNPLYFRAAPGSGPQGPYQIEELEFA